MKRAAQYIFALAALVAWGWFFPPFHIVPLNTATAEKVAAKFDATMVAENFWTNQLVPAIDKTVDAQTLLSTLQSDATAAKEKKSRGAGVGDSYFYFLLGEGKIVSVSDDAVSIVVLENSTNAEVALQAGFVFGNALRDGTGLLNASDYPNSQDFND